MTYKLTNEQVAAFMQGRLDLQNLAVDPFDPHSDPTHVGNASAPAGCAPRGPGWPNYGGVQRNPCCYKGGQLLCDMQQCFGALQGVGAAAAGTLRIVPTVAPWFEPLGIKIFVNQDGAENLNARVRLHSVAIGGSPQLAVDNRAPVLADIDWCNSDIWDGGNDLYHVPISWAPFSTAALTSPLDIFFFNNSGGAIDISASIVGNALNSENPLDYHSSCPMHPKNRAIEATRLAQVQAM